MSTFQYTQPTEEQIALMQTYRDQFEALSTKMSELPPSRGLSLAQTNLEQAAFWLNKAITHNS